MPPPPSYPGPRLRSHPPEPDAGPSPSTVAGIAALDAQWEFNRGAANVSAAHLSSKAVVAACLGVTKAHPELVLG